MDFPVLADLDEPTRREVLRSPRHRFAPHEVVFHAGDAANSMHLLCSGHASVQIVTPAGDVAILTVLGPGATFGELALLSETATRSATVTALDQIETLVLSRDRFAQLRRTNPAVDRFLVGLLTGYVRRLESRLLDALYLPVEKRVLRQVLTLCRVYGGVRDGTVVPVTQDVLAEMAGTTRPTTNQVLRGAESAGLVSMSRGRIRLEDAAGLTRRAR